MTDRSRPRPALAAIIAALVAVYVIWGTTYFAIRQVVLNGMPTFFFIGTRFVVAGALPLIWGLSRGAPLPTPRQWRNAGLVGVLLLVGGNGCVTLAEHSVTSGATVALLSIAPLIAAALAGLFGEWPRPMEWFAMALGTTGVGIMLLGHDFQASPIGTALLLLSSLSWSLGAVVARHLDIPGGAVGFGAEMFCAGLVACLISLALGERWNLPTVTEVWAGWGYLVVFGSILGFSAFRFLVERVSSNLAMTYAYANPPVALLTGWWLGNEHFSAPLLAGLPIVLGAVALQTWIHARSKPI